MQLYPFQRTGVEFLKSHKRAYLADIMGLGKTVQALVAIKELGTKRNLIIVPNNLRTQWLNEAKIWAPDTRIKVLSYTKHREMEELIRDQPFDVVVLDEAHFAKNDEATRAQLSLKIASKAEYGWLMSGTPSPNDPSELYYPMKMMWPGILARLGTNDRMAFINRFCFWSMSKYGIKILQADRTQIPHLKKELETVMLRRTLNDVGIEMPSLTVSIARLPYNRELNATIAANAKDGELHTATLRRILGLTKSLSTLDIIVDELERNEYKKIVLVAHHTQVLNIIAKKLEKFRPAGIRGGMSVTAKNRSIDMFNNDPECRVFIAQQTVGGVGLNLQVANEMVLLEPSWSPGDNIQAIKRIHRVNQKYPCRVRIFVADGSYIDNKVMETIQNKMVMQKELGLRSSTTWNE